MIATNSNFDAKNLIVGAPIYAMQIGGQATVYTSADLVAAGVTSRPTYKAFLKTPSGSTQTIDVKNGTSSIGEMTCEVVDYDGSVLTLVGGTTLDGAAITVLVGYPGMSYADFVTINTFRLIKVNPTDDYTAYVFTSRDRQSMAKRVISLHPINGKPLSASNPWIVQGTPGEITLAVYLQGLQLTLNDVGYDAIVALDRDSEALFNSVRPFYFELTAAFECKQFLESEVYRPCGLYPVIDNLGRISLKAFRAGASGGSTSYDFTDDNCVALPAIDRAEILNSIVVNCDYDGSSYQSELVYVDATSVGQYGAAAQIKIDSQGLRTEMGASWFTEEFASRMFARFSGGAGLRGGAMIASIEAMLMTLPVWVGDYVHLTAAKMPNLTTGFVGVSNRVMEVIDRTPDFANGKMQYKLLDTGLTGLQAAHQWSSSSRDFVVASSTLY